MGDRTIRHAAWVRDEPPIDDMLVLSWQPGVLDRWLEEDEVVGGHPRDPHKRVEVIASSRHVIVERDGVRLADSQRPALLFETNLPTRYYLPREDVDFSALESTTNRSHCPYKGYADEYWSVAGHPMPPTSPGRTPRRCRPSARSPGRVAFYNELVDITVDGVRQTRPESPFSAKANRPN